MTERLTASLEDYLEAIYHIIVDKGAARPKDIAKSLDVTNASVTGALRSLADKRLIKYAPYEIVTFTEDGMIMAKEIVRRHELLREFMINVLGVERGKADEAACLMEHAIPADILERFALLAEHTECCPRAGSGWFKGGVLGCDGGVTVDFCSACASSVLAVIEKTKSDRKSGEKIMKNLRQVSPGQKCRVIRLRMRGEVNKRMMEMGFTAGAVVEMERVAPLGDPLEMKVKGYHLSIRKEDAEKIDVEML